MNDLISAKEAREYAQQTIEDQRALLAVLTVIDMVQRTEDMWEAEWLPWNDGWFNGYMCSRCLHETLETKSTCPACGRKMKEREHNAHAE